MILVRHAYAGHKANWDRDDTLRPLTARGVAQAESLVLSFADEGERSAYEVEEVQPYGGASDVADRQPSPPVAKARSTSIDNATPTSWTQPS